MPQLAIRPYRTLLDFFAFAPIYPPRLSFSFPFDFDGKKYKKENLSSTQTVIGISFLVQLSPENSHWDACMMIVGADENL